MGCGAALYFPIPSGDMDAQQGHTKGRRKQSHFAGTKGIFEKIQNQEENKYEVRTWNNKDEVSEPSHFNSLEECKNYILDTIIKNTIGKKK